MVIKMNKLVAITLASLLVTGVHAVEASDLNIKEWEQNLFNELDTNKDGSMDDVEFRGTTKEWMTKAGYSEEKQIKQTNNKFKGFDHNEDNKVSLEEYVVANRANNATAKAAKEKQQIAKASKEKKTANKPVKKDPDSLLQIGDIAPNFLGTDKDGNKVYVDELRGKVIIVSFWISWCKQCKDGLGILNNLQNKVGSDLLKVVAVAHRQESKRSFKKYKKQLSAMNLTLTHDSRKVIGRSYGVDKAPHLFIIGKDGKILFMDSDYNQTPVSGIVETLKKELTK